MKTIEQRWTDFEAIAIAYGAPVVQRQEMRIAFFAGYTASLSDGLEIATMTEAAAMRALTALHAESRSFSIKLGAVADGYVDCGECPAISTGCRAGQCMRKGRTN